MRKKRIKLDVVTIWGIVLIVASATLFCAIEFSKLPHVLQWYEQYEHTILDFQTKIVQLDNRFWIFIIILLLYFLKSVIPFPLYPASFLCVLTSIVFNTYLSLVINLLGLVLLFGTKYFWGNNFGSVFVKKVLPRYEKLWSIIEHEGNGNPVLLVVSRAVPSFPINAVSSIYGSLGFSFLRYIFLSIIGFAPKLVFYTIIGRNVFNPLSSAFLMPIAILLLFTGMSMIGVNKTIEFISKKINLKHEVEE